MKTNFFAALLLLGFFVESCSDKNTANGSSLIIGSGQMPDIASDGNSNFHVVYGSGDSIMYSSSVNDGKAFSSPALVAVLPYLAASHMRGPQIAFGKNGITIIAVNKWGDIFSCNKDASGKWNSPVKVNDVDSVAKEGLMDLNSEDQHLFAVWLDLRNKYNQIYGAASTDGGKTWSKNKLVYASPDTTVCECCKPSVAVRDKKVYVMFRNWLKGNRDLYLIESTDNGETFGEAKKLGNDSWALNGCPMDGGGLAINDNGSPETVWLRKNTIYTCEPGEPESVIGEGRSCTMESVNGKNIYAWTENGEVVVLNPQHEKRVLGKGSMPVIRSIGNDEILCVWENEKKIYSEVVKL
ncbi:MAG: sialidase family protein [Bacteroidota bacterium]